MNTVQDELMHYGVLGMKWGKRSAGKTISKAANSVGDRFKASGKMGLNTYVHPIMSSKAASESMKGNKFGTKMRRAYLYQTTAEIKDINRRVESMKAQKVSSLDKAKVSRGKEVTDKILNRITETGRYEINQTIHPIKTSKATRDSLTNDSTGTKLRRAFAYQTTSEMQDINQRVRDMS